MNTLNDIIEAHDEALALAELLDKTQRKLDLLGNLTYNAQIAHDKVWADTHGTCPF